MVRSRERVHPVHVNEHVASTRTNKGNKSLAGHATRTRAQLDQIYEIVAAKVRVYLLTRNGIGGFTETRYSYQGSKGHLQGIGPLGHRMTKSLSVETGIST